MNKNVYTILLILSTHLIITDSNAQFSFKNFRRCKPEKIEQKEYAAASLTTLSLTNSNGSVTIKTGPQKSLFLRTIKRAKKEDDLNFIEIVVDSSKQNHLAISTKQSNKNKTGSVEYELIVPASLDIAVTITGKGNVFIKDVQGTIDVVAHDTITIINTKKKVSATALKKGSIFITNSLGPVDAQSHQGNICGEHSGHNFIAHSTKGNISVTYKKLCSTSAISLSTTSGNIMLALPTDVNAALYCSTKHGTVTSDHYITIKPSITQLNKNAWDKFKKEVDGTLGSPQAGIMVQSIKGNIKIVETKTT